MNTRTRRHWIRSCVTASVVAGVVALGAPARAEPHGRWSDLPQQLPTGQYITPTAARGAIQQFLNPGLADYPDFVAGEAVRSQLSPDGRTLAILCAGHNSLVKPDGTTDEEASTQFIFLYDVAGKHRHKPKLTQVIPQKNAHVGLVFAPDGRTLYAAGGSDDAVYAYTQRDDGWTLAASIELGHSAGIGVDVQPNASGLGISADGRTLVVANNYNDSISVIDTESNRVRYEHDLRPYHSRNEGKSGAAGGTFPFGVVVKGNGTVYVSSDRDREVSVVDISSPTEGRLVKRIKLRGNALGMALDVRSARLFVAEDNADRVAVIDTEQQALVAEVDARAPAGLLPDADETKAGASRHTGVATFTVTLSPDGTTLYAVNAGSNAIAVIPLTGPAAYQVTGLIPTAYEPHDVTLSADGRLMYIVNGKNVTGPNPGHLSGATDALSHVTYPEGNTQADDAARASNQYQFQLERASLISASVPTPAELRRLTQIVALNNFYVRWGGEQDRKVMAFLREHIKHIIYVVKENRTFDQILGDLDNGAEADPSLAQFGQAYTPNLHNLARRFVTLDNFMDPGNGSMDGWSWSLQGRVTNTETITQQINYAFVSRGLSYESEGTNRNVPVNWATQAERDRALGPAGTTNYTDATESLPGGTANVLAGTGNHASSDAPFEAEDGYIFSAVLQAGGSVRSYGFLVRNIGDRGTREAPLAEPFAAGETQVAPLDPELAPYTDVYFRGYDQVYPDLWRYNEWKREFDGFVDDGQLPSLSMVRLSHDHMGAFDSALGAVDTPETQQADNDLAVGLLVQAVSQSPYAADTLIVITEDDCQDGPDHVDSHRATAYLVGPYVRQGQIVSTHYGQVNALRTIEDILGTEHMNLNTATQAPMTDVFDISMDGGWSFVAEASTVLQETELALAAAGLQAQYSAGPAVRSQHDAAYWAKRTRGFDFSEADRVSPLKFNRVLWHGLMGDKPYPRVRLGRGKRAAQRAQARAPWQLSAQATR